MQNDFKLNYDGNKEVDLWWGGLKGNGALMMIVAHMIKTSPRWRNINIRVKMVVDSEAAVEPARENLQMILNQIRVDFSHHVIVADGRNFWDIMEAESDDSSMVMIGLKEPDDDFHNYYTGLKEKTKSIKNKLFLLASEEIEFNDILN